MENVFNVLFTLVVLVVSVYAVGYYAEEHHRNVDPAYKATQEARAACAQMATSSTALAKC